MVTTRGDLKRHIAAEIGLDQTVAGVEDLLMNDWAQDAVYDFLIETRVHLASGTLALVAGQQDYSMVSAVPNALGITEASISSGGSRYGLERVSMEELLDWRRTSQTLDRTRKFACEGDLFMVYPTPAQADTITFYGPSRPTPFSTDADDFTTAAFGGIPVQHSPALISYMRWRAGIYDERKVPHTPDQLRQFYELELARARRRIRRMGGRTLPGLRAGYPDQGSPGNKSAIYPPVG